MRNKARIKELEERVGMLDVHFKAVMANDMDGVRVDYNTKTLYIEADAPAAPGFMFESYDGRGWFNALPKGWVGIYLGKGCNPVRFRIFPELRSLMGEPQGEVL